MISRQSTNACKGRMGRADALRRIAGIGVGLIAILCTAFLSEAPAAAAPVTFTVSGRVTVGGAGVEGAVVAGGADVQFTAADGSYTLSGFPAGSYGIIVNAPGHAFAQRTVTVGPSQTGVDFEALATISGTVRVGGVGFGGALVSGAGQTVTTAPDGTYAITGVDAGNYLVQCYVIGYTFTDRVVAVGPSQSGVDFNTPLDPAQVGPFTISGKVTTAGVGQGGVIVSGAGQVVFTAPDGSYTLTNVARGAYGIIATGVGLNFPLRNVLVGPSQTGVNFDSPATVSGRVTVGGVGLGGVVVAGGSDVTITAADGSYTLTGFTAGNYGIIASAPGLSFPVQNVSVGPNQTGVDFALP